MNSLIPAMDISKRFPTTILVVAIHSLLWIVWLLGLFWWVPRAARVIRSFNMRVPHVTTWVLDLSQWVSTYLLVAGIALCVFLVADGLIYYRLLLSTRRFRKELWSLSMILLPSLIIVGSAYGILYPLLLLSEALSR